MWRMLPGYRAHSELVTGLLVLIIKHVLKCCAGEGLVHLYLLCTGL